MAETLKLVNTNLENHSIAVQDIEAIKAEYLNPDYIHEPVYFNYRINNRGKRFYARVYENKEIKTAPSFSAIKETVSPIPYGLMDWFIRNGYDYCNWFKEHSANYGTYFHSLCGRILRGEKISTTESYILVDMQIFFNKEEMDFDGCVAWMKKEKRDLRKDLYGFCRWAQDYKVKPIAIEYPVMDPDAKYAGTIDLICKITLPLSKEEIKENEKIKKENEKILKANEGKKRKKKLLKEITGQEIIAMVDLKSGQNGFYGDHEIQLHAYRPLWDAEYPDLKIERVYNLGCHDFRIPISDRVTPYKFKDQTESDEAYKWGYWVKLFHANPKNVTIEIKTDFAMDKILSIDADFSDVFESVNPLEFLKSNEVPF